MANSFDHADSLIVVPASSRKEKAVCLGAKLLETKKEARKVLPEEKYVENLEKIITRDYYPELPKLKAQAEYLEAVAKGDHLKIRELQIRYSTRRTDRRTSPSARPSSPSVFDPETPGPSVDANQETPYANMEGDNEYFTKKRMKETPLDKLTVQSYLDSYTSEDNASFEELAELHKKKERVRNAWMYEAEKRHNESLVFTGPAPIKAADEQLLAIKNNELVKPFGNDNWSYTARNSVLFNPEEAPLTMAEYMERAKQNEKIINKEATRFKAEFSQQPHKTAMARAAFQQAANNSGHVDVTGKELGVLSTSALGLVATPSPAPGVEDTPLMTWGEIEGTPFRLDAPEISATASDAPAFKIPDVPLRERVAQDIADEIARRYHGKRNHAMNQIQKIAPKTPSFSSSRCSSGRLANMSPAARRLATDKLGIRVSTDKMKMGSPYSSASGGSVRSSFSPALHKLVKVKREPSASPRSVQSSDADVTDNLFNLPPSPVPNDVPDLSSGQSNNKANAGRRRAADFF